ncbi:MAG TPA: hypothetical protein VN133_05320 [Humibacter sp.]|nr:hypothetical protein [Humibacter sp.]
MRSFGETQARRVRAGIALTAGAGIVLLALLAGAPASAATVHDVPDSGILVSADGTHFVNATSAPLFDAARRIIPGERETASLYVRNTSKHAAVIAVHATNIRFASIELAQLLELGASTQTITGAPVRLSDGQCLPLISSVSLPAGVTTHVNLTLVMSAGANGSAGQNQSADFDVLVSARDRTEPAFAASDCATGIDLPGVSDPAGAGSTTGSAGGSAGLADTGSELLVPFSVAAMLFGAGAALVVAARRRRRDEPAQEPAAIERERATQERRAITPREWKP